MTIEPEGDNDNLRFRAVRPLTDLGATMEFTRDQYLPGELAEAKVTLSNEGTTPMTGLVVNCNRVGNPRRADR